MKYKYKKQKQKTKQNNHTDITKLKYLIHFSSNLFELHANNWNHSSPHKNPLKLDIRLF